eukprot:g48021.t1
MVILAPPADAADITSTDATENVTLAVTYAASTDAPVRAASAAVTANSADHITASTSAHVAIPIHIPTPETVSNPTASSRSTPSPTAVPCRVFTIPLDFLLTQDEWPNQSPSTDTLVLLTELVLTLNNFSFKSSHFLQTKGVALGIHMGLSYAYLFVGYVEQSLFCCYTSTIPHIFLYYIDDCIGAASCSHEELN